MKKDTIKILAEPDDIHGFTRRLWRSKHFQDSHDNHGLVYQAVEQFARLPRFFFETSHDAENPHFSAWWGGIQMREYDNPAVHDLYYLHEIWHAGTMLHIPGLSPEAFRIKMFENEQVASVISEMAIYFEMPELRKETFPYEIYVDRFLFSHGWQAEPDADMLRQWSEDRDHLLTKLKFQRLSARLDPVSAKDKDDIVYWLQRFASQHKVWAQNWEIRYDQVETAMDQLETDSKRIGRKSAMDVFMKWLTSDEVTCKTDIPFVDEAYAFYASYRLFKTAYQDTFEKIKTAKPVSYTPSVGTPALTPS